MPTDEKGRVYDAAWDTIDDPAPVAPNDEAPTLHRALRRAMDHSGGKRGGDDPAEARHLSLDKFPGEVGHAFKWLHRRYLTKAVTEGGYSYERHPSLSEVLQAALRAGVPWMESELHLPKIDLDSLYETGAFGQASNRLRYLWARGGVLGDATVRLQPRVPGNLLARMQDRADQAGVEFTSYATAALVAGLAADESEDGDGALATVFDRAPWPWPERARAALKRFEQAVNAGVTGILPTR